MCDLNTLMNQFCSCLRPTQDPCIQCKKPLWSAERQANQCVGCDRNQNELCANCPNKIQNIEQFIVLTTRREAESIDGNLGFELEESFKPCEPVDESFPHFACRLLQLERRKADAIDLIHRISETEQYLRKYWEKTYGTARELDCRVFITHHPFMQYLSMLLKIRVLEREASLYQIAHVVEGIAGL